MPGLPCHIGTFLYLGAICEFVTGQVDLSERSFPYESPKRIVSNRSQLIGGELTRQRSALIIDVCCGAENLSAEVTSETFDEYDREGFDLL
jgi:hypothetical protein